MSRARDSFAQSILDSENLLAHFNALNTKPPRPQLEVLKRAGLIMAMTAWETYVEDRILEAAVARLEAATRQSNKDAKTWSDGRVPKAGDRVLVSQWMRLLLNFLLRVHVCGEHFWEATLRKTFFHVQRI